MGDEVPTRETLPQKSVADHEVFLSFNSDDEGLAFRDWLFDEGYALFREYFKSWESLWKP